MKRIALFFSLLAALAVGGGAVASTASAANCTNITVGAIVRSVFAPPSWYHTSDHVSGCTGVNAVRFNTNVGTNGTQIVDLSACSPTCFAAGPYINNGNTYPNIPNPAVVVGPSPGPYVSTSEYGCWFVGPGSHLLYHSLTMAIRNSNGNTWGQDHTYFGPNTWVQGC